MKVLAMAALAVALGGTQALASELLTGEQIRETIVGNTITYTTEGGRSIAERANPNGSFVAMDLASQEKVRGSWQIEDDTICYTYFSSPSSGGCARVYRTGPAQSKFFMADEPLGGDVALEPGNPHGL